MDSEQLTEELRLIRKSIDDLSARVHELAHTNQELRQDLEASQTARADLVAQAEHLIHQLAQSREEVRVLKSQAQEPN